MLSGLLESFPPPSADEHKRFLISFLFGGRADPGPADCVARAYRDFSRTAHGITKTPARSNLKTAAHSLVVGLLAEAIDPPAPWRLSAFDTWHQKGCARICAHYARGGYPTFRIGQAQKWLNMSIKYALSLAALDIVAIKHPQALRRVAHVPLDEFILTALMAYNAPTLPRKWSQISDYGPYMAVQQWIRTRFPNSSPLDVEFHTYIEETTRRLNRPPP